jgi:predicted ABC-class ATPase
MRTTLTAMDGRPYPAYRALERRSFEVGPARVTLVRVQADPFAAPTRVQAVVPGARTELPAAALASATARRATADFLHRALAAAFASSGATPRALRIVDVGPEVLERTAVTVGMDGAVTVLLTVGLPATGRRIRGHEAAHLLTDLLPAALTLACIGFDRATLATHVASVEDQMGLRAQLGPRGLVAFLADGSVLPRRSGIDERPLPDAVALVAPEALAVTLTAPHGGPLRGLGIPRGVTLLVGGGYHGKSTVLTAIAAGIYDHVPGDGRERCVTSVGAVTVRAEDGRAVRGVDLRPFIGTLPFGRSTACFSTDDASGSTSQAAAVVEALEAGADALLIDEDTAAANFMTRDVRMCALIAAADEPITPFRERVRSLYATHGVSSILVVGGTGDFLDVADTVVQLQSYQPHDLTPRARVVAAEFPRDGDGVGPLRAWPPPQPRWLDEASLYARGRRGTPRARGHATRAIDFGADEIDVSLVGQLVEGAQCHFLGDVLLACAAGLIDGRVSLAQLLARIESRIEAGGIGALASPGFGDRALVRRFEVAAVLNRLRGLRLSGVI